jgi:hypothetical protein
MIAINRDCEGMERRTIPLGDVELNRTIPHCAHDISYQLIHFLLIIIETEKRTTFLASKFFAKSEYNSSLPPTLVKSSLAFSGKELVGTAARAIAGNLNLVANSCNISILIGTRFVIRRADGKLNARLM